MATVARPSALAGGVTVAVTAVTNRKERAMNTTCERCRRSSVLDIVIDDSSEVCGHTFTAQLPATRCLACKQVVIQAEHVKGFERRIAVELAKAGVRNPEAFRYLRHALDLPDVSFAELLDVPVEYVHYWETGKWPVDPRALSVLGALVVTRFEGTHCALDALRVLRNPRKLAAKVRVELNGGAAHAAKMLQAGSAAFKPPELS
jgi:DNA-binding transcriptional regulator YiaG